MESSGHHVQRLPEHGPQHEQHHPEPATGTGSPRPALGYLTLTERPLLRLLQLFLGLGLFGFSLSLMVRTALGVNPWSVLYQGLHYHTPLSFGQTSAALGALVLLLWIPLRQKPTLGTVANIAVVGASSDLGLAVVPDGLGLVPRIGLVAAGIVLNGLSVAVYVGARFGPGPRDGLMTGLADVTGRSIRLVRTLIELVVLGIGWLLDGSVGIGTVLYALLVGPVTQFFLPWFTYRQDAATPPRPGLADTRERP